MWISCDICRFLFADTLVPDIVQVGSQFQFDFVPLHFHSWLCSNLK